MKLYGMKGNRLVRGSRGAAASSLRGLALLLLCCVVLAAGNGCALQELAGVDGLSVVKVRLNFPDGGGPAAVRGTLAGSGRTLYDVDYAMAREDGTISIETGLMGETFLVIKSLDYAPAYARVFIDRQGGTYTVSSIQAGPGSTASDPPALRWKDPGKVLILFFERDWPELQVTSVALMSELNGFDRASGLVPLNDSGIEGDYVAGDHVWSVEVSTASTSLGYLFVVNGMSEKPLRDPHEESSTFCLDADGHLREVSVVYAGKER